MLHYLETANRKPNFKFVLWTYEYMTIYYFDKLVVVS
jgi:hypothetical protein